MFFFFLFNKNFLILVLENKLSFNQAYKSDIEDLSPLGKKCNIVKLKSLYQMIQLLSKRIYLVHNYTIISLPYYRRFFLLIDIFFIFIP